MEKKLKPYTIIPPDLYVNREADKQVANIINDMGRPGYVLVSRQMGKTNLLLNAKRKLETDSLIFIYVDLSNTFKDARSCFENIIDVAMESYSDKFSSISELIHSRRLELKDTPPHRQHTNELRILLKALNGGKMVIVLDEIDALTKTDYSDQIFSQIRSSYFASRVNYPEFFNLTYLLSGVVEPNEIIKDPKISPFNIGQKIYLNDFTKIEFTEFAKTAKLNLNTEIIDRIFFWTNGNPRISWDVCAEIENWCSNGNHIQAIDVDNIVTEMYLVTFDRPPIDNIRELVKNDREIRNSIVEIEYNKGKQISDRLKSKLYLAGIINYYEDDIKVKNEIIRKSLSYEWIRKLEEEEKGLIKIAMEDYQNLNYFDSLSSFEKYLIDYEFSDGPNIPHYYYIMGHCAYKLQDFDKALKYFSLSDFDVEDESIWYFKLMHQKGLTYYYLGRIEECLECLKIIIDKGKKDTVYARALLNYGSITLQSDIETHKDNAERIFNEIVNGTAFKVEKIKEPVLQELKSISFFNLGQIYAFGNTNSLKAIEYFKNAVSFSPDSSKPRIILALLPLLSDAIEKKDYTTQLYELIDSGVITPKDEDPERPMDFNYDELRDYLLLVFLEYRESIFPLLKSHFRLLGEKTLAKHLFELAVFSINKNSDWDKAKIVFQYIRDCFDFAEMEIDADTRFSTLKLLAYISVVNDSYAIYVEYITSLRDKESKRIDFIDLEIFANFINQLTEEGKVEEAIESAELIESFRVFASDDMMLNYLVIYHLELNARVKINDFERVISLAEKIVQLAENETIKMLKSNLIGEVEVGIGLIRNNAQAILRQLTKLNPIKVEKGFGRNDLVKVRYKDGVTVLAKYKKIKDDIASGACIVLQ